MTPDRDRDAADPEAAALEPAPEYVLAYIHPRTWKHPITRVFYEGVWSLYTAAEWNHGQFQCLPEADRLIFAPCGTSREVLTVLAHRALGFPVALKPGTARHRGGRGLAHEREEPLFWVRRQG